MQGNEGLRRYPRADRATTRALAFHYVTVATFGICRRKREYVVVISSRCLTTMVPMGGYLGWRRHASLRRRTGNRAYLDWRR